MAQLPQSHLRLTDLTNRRATDFELTPSADERKAVARDLGITGVKKLRFSGHLDPVGARDWTLTATLGATVVQDCVVTLTPVTTRIDEAVERNYVAGLPAAEGAELEMPEDDTVEPLPTHIDLMRVMSEALSLALPVYPRSTDATLADAQFTAPGLTPMSDTDAKPFAGLGALREHLENKDE